MKLPIPLSLLFSLTLVSSMNDCSQLDVSNMPTADNLTKESYITPEMQWSVLSLLNDRAVAVLDKESGAIENLPSVSEMLQTISNKMVYFSNAEKESMKKALNAMMEATEIAKFVVAAKVAYRDQNFMMLHQQLIGELNNQKMMITMMLNNLNAKNAFDQPVQQSSYFSWVWGGSTAAPVQSYVGNPMQSVPVADLSKITLQADFMNSVVTNNDYKKMPDATQAANLLFKQCFIAQQQFAKNIIPLQLNNAINPSTYIYANFPEIYNKFSNNYPICQKIQDIVMHEPFRSNVMLPVTEKQQQAFAMLLQIRQAVQTAIDIANKKSTVNVGSLLPSSVVSYLDGIVSQLMKYDAHLATLCNNPQFGATSQDIALSQEWSTFTKVAAGTAVAAAVIGTAWYFDVLPGTGTKKTEGAVFGPENKKIVDDPKLLNVLAGGTKLGKDTKKLLGAITDHANKGQAVQDAAPAVDNAQEQEEQNQQAATEEQAARLQAEREAQELAEQERIKEDKRQAMAEIAADADRQLAEKKTKEEEARLKAAEDEAADRMAAEAVERAQAEAAERVRLAAQENGKKALAEIDKAEQKRAAEEVRLKAVKAAEDEEAAKKLAELTAKEEAARLKTETEAEKTKKDTSTLVDQLAQASKIHDQVQNTEDLAIEQATNSILPEIPGLLSKAFSFVTTKMSDAANAQAKALQKEKDDAFAAKIGELERLSKEVKAIEGRWKILKGYSLEEKKKLADFYRLQEEVTTETARRKTEADRLEKVRMESAKLSSVKEEKIQSLKTTQIRLASQIKAQQDFLNNRLMLIKTLEDKIEALHGENNKFEDLKKGINLEIEAIKAKIALSEDRLNGKVDVSTKIKTQGLIELRDELYAKIPGFFQNSGMSAEDSAAIKSRYNAAKRAVDYELGVKEDLTKKLTALTTKLTTTEKAQATSNSDRQKNIKTISDEINKIIDGNQTLGVSEEGAAVESSSQSIKKIKADLQALEQKKQVADQELEDLEPSLFTSLWSKVSNYQPKTDITSKSFKQI